MRFFYFASLITWPIKCARNISSADEPWRAEVKRFSDSFKILNCGQLLKSYSILNRRCFLGRKRALCRRWCVAIALKAFTTLSSFWPFPKLNLSQYLHVSINVSSSSIIQQQQQKSLSITCFDWKAICISCNESMSGPKKSPTVTWSSSFIASRRFSDWKCMHQSCWKVMMLQWSVIRRLLHVASVETSTRFSVLRTAGLARISLIRLLSVYFYTLSKNKKQTTRSSRCLCLLTLTWGRWCV